MDVTRAAGRVVALPVYIPPVFLMSAVVGPKKLQVLEVDGGSGVAKKVVEFSAAALPESGCYVVSLSGAPNIWSSPCLQPV